MVLALAASAVDGAGNSQDDIYGNLPLRKVFFKIAESHSLPFLANEIFFKTQTDLLRGLVARAMLPYGGEGASASLDCISLRGVDPKSMQEEEEEEGSLKRFPKGFVVASR